MDTDFARSRRSRCISDTRVRTSVNMPFRSMRSAIESFSRFATPLVSRLIFACDADAVGGPILPLLTHWAINSCVQGTCTLGLSTGAVFRYFQTIDLIGSAPAKTPRAQTDPQAGALSIRPFQVSRWRLRRTRQLWVLIACLVLGYGFMDIGKDR